MKAIILAGGRGNRLNTRSKEKNKCMFLLDNKPVIEYSLDNVISTDIQEIIIIVGYRAEDIINHYGKEYKGRSIKYVIQREQKGLVHAIKCASFLIDDDNFMMLLGDEVMVRPRHRDMLEEFNRNKIFGICGVLKVKDKKKIKKTYTLVQDDNRVIYRLVEKPNQPLNNMMGTGDCIFNNRILDYIDITPIHHKRGEKELPDLIQCAIDEGKEIRSFDICAEYFNVNSELDLKEAEEYLEK